VADAIGRLYTEFNLLKYDTGAHAFRFADVIDLVHPAPAAPWQGDLFRVALNRQHNRGSQRRRCRCSWPTPTSAPRWATSRRCRPDADPDRQVSIDDRHGVFGEVEGDPGEGSGGLRRIAGGQGRPGRPARLCR
jgi:hypothetical protein